MMMKTQRWGRPHLPSDLNACYGEIVKQWVRAEDAEIERDRLAAEVKRLSCQKADLKQISDRIAKLEAGTARIRRAAARTKFAHQRRERRT